MPWLDAALSPEWTLADLLPHVEAGRGVLIADAARNDAIGAAVVLLGEPRLGSASVPFIAMDPSRRFRGLGGEAALTLEQHLRDAHRIAAVYAPVPDWRGLAVYYWLRLGYRPLSVADAPGPLVGLNDVARAGIWMLRDAV
jgi:hypothetical protein